MKILIASILNIFVMFAAASGQGVPGKIADFAFMAGCWQGGDPAKGLVSTEQWMKPAGTSMLGMGRTVWDGKTTEFEYMRIEQRDDGIYFVARPSANAGETPFKLKSLTGGRAVFENLEHDFPQRIIYSGSAGRMVGRVEGNSNGKPTAIDFPFTRTSCE